MNGIFDEINCVNECMALFPPSGYQTELDQCLSNCYNVISNSGEEPKESTDKKNDFNILLPLGIGIGLAILATSKW